MSIPSWLVSQDLEANQEILNKALKMSIVVRLILPDNEQETAWEQSGEQITLPGRPVTLKLENKVLRIYGLFTPYILKGNDLFLLAQGQVWIFNTNGKELRYFSYVKSLPVVAGEKVFFFPLGRSSGSQGSDFYTIEIEIQINALLNNIEEGTAQEDGK
ncbi:MAG: hypothetical protein JW969_05555 [Spirochaetales bacterium]|nr:hypothetical protein [Spirochaetales bacterium]